MAELESVDTTDDCLETETLLRQRRKEEIVPLKKDLIQQTNDESSEFIPYRPKVPRKLKILRATVYILYKSVNLAYIPIFIYRKFQRSKKCTKVTDDLLRIPANELARKIRRREISCEEVVRSYISRIEEVNPLLNAVVDSRFAEAIEDAKKVDQLVYSEEFLNDEEKIAEQFPLLGVPITVKGSIAVKGLKYTSGMVARKNIIAEKDAVTVELARKAGAIPLLVSNVPELCMNWETANKLIGKTNNPHGTSRSSGGSSGGEGSLMGAGASLIGIGSDLAGSLRLPAHFCGVYGHKPTPGVVSYEGHIPSCPHHEEWEAFFTLGPMARYAGDLRTLLGVIAKPEKREKLQLNKKIDVKKVKVFFLDMEDFYWNSPSRHCIEAAHKAIDHFKFVCDTPPKKVEFPLFQYAPELASIKLLSIDDIDFILDDDKRSIFNEIFRYTTFRSKHCIITICYGIFHEIVKSLSVESKEKVEKCLSLLRRDFEKTLGNDGVLIMPTATSAAFKHCDAARFALCSGCMSIFNALGFPVTCCPVGVTKKGFPLGVQVVGLPYSDTLTLAVAEEIERAFGGWIEP